MSRHFSYKELPEIKDEMWCMSYYKYHKVISILVGNDVLTDAIIVHELGDLKAFLFKK